MSDVDEIRLDQAKKIEMESKWDCGEHEDFSQEHIEECLSEMLAAYIGDERNYVVDGAIVECDQMSSRPVQMYYKDGKLKMIGEGGSAEVNFDGTISPYEKLYLEINRNEEAIGRLYAVHADKQTDMNLRYATVADRVCLREIVDREKKGEKSAYEASLVSFGNCKIMRNSDVLEVKERIHKAARYGTCYCLMKPDWQWQNPYCMESVTGNCDAESNSRLNLPTAGVASVLDYKPTCTTTSHHKTMEWDTKEGKKEGLTRLSTLLCIRGGVITIKYSGQYAGDCLLEALLGNDEIINVKEQILYLLEQENGLQLVSEYLDKIKAENPDYVQFLELLAYRESSGNYDAISASGSYLGRYQIGNIAFRDIEFKDQNNQWTQLAKSLGIHDNDSYLNNQIGQEVAILFALRKDYYYVSHNGDDNRIGEYADGVEVTASGLIGAAHLVGHNELHKGFSEEKSWDDIKDGNGVKATTYMEEMGGLDLSGILGGIE